MADRHLSPPAFPSVRMLGAGVCALREERGWTVEHLAKEAGIQ
ncbi:hypothetical protein ACFV42_43420 [Streptomyces solisilvae]